jgi:uncharacterized cupredoxin-like copper-binding protein
MRRRIAALLLATLALGACGGDDDDEEAAAPERTIEIVETDFALDPETVRIDSTGTYAFRAVNEGETEHALEIEGQGIEEETDTIGPGETAEVTVEITEPGEYELYCPVGDHKDRGMEGSLEVAG